MRISFPVLGSLCTAVLLFAWGCSNGPGGYYANNGANNFGENNGTNNGTNNGQNNGENNGENNGTEGFAITAVEDAGLAGFFTKQVSVFGVVIVATAATPDDKVLHAANVLAEYLDNDEDGTVDDPLVLENLLDNRALLVMFATENEVETSGIFESDAIDGYGGQDLYAEETAPGGGRFDATLEEVLHLVSNYGYEPAYPSDLGTRGVTRLTNAMDIARGGHFEQVPSTYPDAAWYHYDDRTCDYGCMASEYFYWGLTTLLGAQSDPSRCGDIAREWEPCTPEQLRETDVALHALLTDPDLGLPTVLPDGNYR